MKRKAGQNGSTLIHIEDTSGSIRIISLNSGISKMLNNELTECFFFIFVICKEGCNKIVSCLDCLK